MAKIKVEEHVEQQFPLRILYSSPPEASSLHEWVQEVESKRNGVVSSLTQSKTDQGHKSKK